MTCPSSAPSVSVPALPAPLWYSRGGWCWLETLVEGGDSPCVDLARELAASYGPCCPRLSCEVLAAQLVRGVEFPAEEVCDVD